MKSATTQATSEDYLNTLEKVKEQYQQYLEVSKLYELPTSEQEEPQIEYQAPTIDNPLTTNTFRM